MKQKRILILADTHCGHRYGLAVKEDCVNKEQRQAWDFFTKGIQKYAPYDVVFTNGDLIDGVSPKNNGVEAITTNRFTQAEMAIRILKYIQSKNKTNPKWCFTYGTPYHSGNAEDFELTIAKEFKSVIDDTLLVKVNGVVFDLKHKIASASLPHTRSNSPNRDILIAMLKEVKEGRPQAKVFIRSHVHYYNFTETLGRIALTTPALQLNSTYGQRQCSGIIDFGFVVVDVFDNGDLLWHKYLLPSPIKKENLVVI